MVGVVLYCAYHVKGKTPWQLLAGDDGRLSLARAQVAGRTIVIGLVLICFSLMRLEPTEIPQQLVVLMGMSLATVGVSYVLGKSKRKQAKPTSRAATATAKAGQIAYFADLICTADENGRTILSIAKAQMLFLTGLLLILFVTKSLLDGNLMACAVETADVDELQSGRLYQP
jgi:hypothetical protein